MAKKCCGKWKKKEKYCKDCPIPKDKRKKKSVKKDKKSKKSK